jgi:hypothetical protein
MEDGAHVITPMWSKTGIVSLAINDGQSAKVRQSIQVEAEIDGSL